MSNIGDNSHSQIKQVANDEQTLKVWAIAYKWQEDVFFDFESANDVLGIKTSCLLPTEQMANTLIEDLLNEDYVATSVEIISYHNGVLTSTYGKVEEWEEYFDDEE